MLTQNEISTLSLSPTKKDFVQIWNELLEVAGKLSERWDPTSTNESDPGIVILKALTGIADKLNYNIDKNILEAFMPTAAQEDSMRKLCEMLGYNIKYYQSAQTTATFKYYNPDPTVDEEAVMRKNVTIPKFTVITNSDQDINYFITENVIISAEDSSKTVPCLEGQLVKCETINADNVVTINQISENNRFYLPETYIAENGMFIYNIANVGTSLIDGQQWIKVDNLNTQQRGKKVFKFGFDSYESRPYIEFPDDYSSLFGEGLFIYYTRTNGISGNISAKTLTKIELPSTGDFSKVSSESFSVENSFAATNGADIETIKQAYNNFKKTIGTFDTLVTCRDYMNKIYSYIVDGEPIVSNILVTDIRTDLNRAITICSCDDAGIFYKEIPLTETVTRSLKQKGSDTIVEVEDEVATIDNFDLVLYPFKRYKQIRSGVKDIRKVYDDSFNYNGSDRTREHIIGEGGLLDNVKTIAHNFKLPRATVVDADTGKVLTIGDILCINNYLRLNATITTSSKITSEEGTLIIDKIKIALANAFNMRELDFGEEIPLDSIIEVIESADTRIRVASLNDPTMYTTFSVYDGYDNGVYTTKEYAVESTWLSSNDAKSVPQLDTTTTTTTNNRVVMAGTFNTEEARKIYNKLAVRNVLAGRVPLFKYDNTFKASFSEPTYQVTSIVTADNIPADFDLPAEFNNGSLNPTSEQPFVILNSNDATYTAQLIDGTIYYTKTFTPKDFANNVITKVENNAITEIATNCEIKAGADGVVSDVTLADGELIKFRAPNFTTKKTYPAYVNYHLALNKKLISEARNAEATTLFELLDADRSTWTPEKKVGWQKLLEYFDKDESRKQYKKTFTATKQISKFSYAAESGNAVCDAENNTTGTHSVNKSTGTCVYCNKKVFGAVTSGNINIQVNESTSNKNKSAEALLLESGCLVLKNEYTDNGFKVRLVWAAADSEQAPDSVGPDLDINLNLSSPFITDISVLNNIWDAINTKLTELVGSVDYAGNPVLPTECSWQICLDFECVPFTQESFTAWETFVKDKNTASEIFGFTPVEESTNILWRVYGEGYQTGKYILSNTKKVLGFERNYFSSLPEKPLQGIYILREIGKDANVAAIKNDEEYKLKANEYLYIEYTPSNTTGDSSSQNSAAVREILGPGTIIRPSGFEASLIDTTVQLAEKSKNKTVAFDTATSTNVSIDMLSLGANEQIEVRDLSKVEINKNFFNSNSAIFYYKNFNGCKELEDLSSRAPYTLKDGEYIFYTDENKAELGYFSTGTQVTLTGGFCLDTCEIIDISTIFESGIQAIPWKRLQLGNSDSITFQEYQYVTIAGGDTLNNTLLLENASGINDTWQYCDDVEYTVFGIEEKQRLSPVNVIDQAMGNGWQVSSLLTLNTSSSNAQVLRNTDKIKTSIDLYSYSEGGLGEYSLTLAPEQGQSELYFKTNLNCQTGSGKITIDDIYLNPDNLESFELKLSVNDKPSVVKTAYGKTIPYIENTEAADNTENAENTDNIEGSSNKRVFDIATWRGETSEIKPESDLWQYISLEWLRQDDSKKFDNAMILPVSTLPNTYGVFCIYVNYSYELQSDIDKCKTWIEFVPGTKRDQIGIIGLTEDELNNSWETAEEGSNKSDKLYLRPGINCLSVKSDNKLFIKANEHAQGTLLFDELKLVKSLPIEYSNNGERKKLYTEGLNIEQLGYLTVKPYDDNVLDADMFNELTASYLDTAYNDLLTIIKDNTDVFNTNVNELNSIKDKLQKIITFVENVSTDIDNLEAQDTKRLITLYNEINTVLTKETQLKNALENNKDNDLAEQQLLYLLKSFSNDNIKVELTSKLNALKEALTAKELAFSESDLLTNFNTVKDNSIVTEILDHIRTKVNNYYSDQLTILADKLDSVVNSDERTRLETVFNSLQANIDAENNIKLLGLIDRLVKFTNESELFNLVDAIYSAILSQDYTAAHTSALQLSDYINYDELRQIVLEVENAAQEEIDTYLQDRLIALAKVLNNSNGSTDAEKDILSYTNIILSESKALASGSSTDTTKILSAADELNTKVNTYFKSTIKSFLAEISSHISKTKTDSEYLKALESLKKSKDTQVDYITAKLKVVTTDWNTQIEKISEISAVADSKKLSSLRADTVLMFKQDAICTVMIDYLNKLFIADLDTFYAKAVAAIDSFSSIAKYTIFENALLSSTVNTASINDLIDDINEAAIIKTQNTTRVNFIEALSKDAFSTSNELSSAMNNIKNSEQPENCLAVLRSLITEFTTSGDSITLADKQQLLSEISVELEKVIDIDRQLFNIITDRISPSLLRTEEEYPEFYSDSFYDKLTKNSPVLIETLRQELSELSEAKSKADIEKIFNTIRNNITLVYNNDGKLLDSLNEGASAIITWLKDIAAGYPTTLLPKNYIENINKCKSAINTIDDAKSALNADFFNAKQYMLIEQKDDYEYDVKVSVVDRCLFISNTIYDNSTGESTTIEVPIPSETITKWLEESSLSSGSDVRKFLNSLIESFKLLENSIEVSNSFKSAYYIHKAELQLLEDIRTIDKNKDFYYTFPIESTLAIDFDEGDRTLNTLMNPRTNYDINNINNCFVISKLDINYLDSGIKIARSSRLN